MLLSIFVLWSLTTVSPHVAFSAHLVHPQSCRGFLLWLPILGSLDMRGWDSAGFLLKRPCGFIHSALLNPLERVPFTVVWVVESGLIFS